MPFVAPIIGIIGAALSATELGMGLAGVGKPSPGDAAKEQQKMLAENQQKQAAADAQAKQKAILASLPNAQEQGGGALESGSLTNLASVIAGLPGEAGTGAGKGALSQFLGTGSTPVGENMVSATYGLNGSQG